MVQVGFCELDRQRSSAPACISLAMGPMHAAATSRMSRVDGDEDTVYNDADGRDSYHCKAALTSGTSVFGVHVGVQRVRLALHLYCCCSSALPTYAIQISSIDHCLYDIK
jgi:hypothetical protein